MKFYSSIEEIPEDLYLQTILAGDKDNDLNGFESDDEDEENINDDEE